MSKLSMPKLGRKSPVRKALALAALAVFLVWVVRHPYQARDGLEHIVHALSVLFSGWGR